MDLKIIEKIDLISDSLEAKGFIKEAYLLDVIANTLTPQMTPQQAAKILLQIKQNPTLLAQLKGEAEKVVGHPEAFSNIAQKEAANSLIKGGLLALMLLAPNIFAQGGGSIDQKVDSVIENVVSEGQHAGPSVDKQAVKIIAADVNKGNFHVVFDQQDSTQSKPVVKDIINKFVKENPGKDKGTVSYNGKNCTVVFWDLSSVDFNDAISFAMHEGLNINTQPDRQFLVQVGSLPSGVHISW